MSSVLDEGRLLARVRHPGVVTIHGAEQIGERIGLWMEYVPGRTLEDLLQAGEPFSSADVIRIGRALSDAVAAVHAAGLLHRDIKAHNVIRAEDGRLMLMDFGTGLEAAAAGSELAGTPLYLAPELSAGSHHRSGATSTAWGCCSITC
jgi:serine/threonine-protein kinase